jgi:hypothetical protein
MFCKCCDLTETLEKDQPPVGGENNQVQSNNRKTIRLERAPKRMAMSTEEMEIIQVLLAVFLETKS